MGLFKPGQSKAVDEAVMHVGTALHKQIAVAIEKAGKPTPAETLKRTESHFTAGYFYGYFQAAFLSLELSEKAMDKCMKKIFDGVFPKRGYTLVKSRIDQLHGADDMGYNIDIEQLASEFALGMDAGRNEATLVKNGKLAAATKLSVYVITGKMNP